VDTSALFITALLGPPALFGVAMLLDQLEERRHRRKLEAARAAAAAAAPNVLTLADRYEAARAAARANHPSTRQDNAR
jgi:hypothetical protein